MLRERLAGELEGKKEQKEKANVTAIVYPFETGRKDSKLSLAADDAAEYYTRRDED